MSTDADKVRAAADYIERVGLHKGGVAEGSLPSKEAVFFGVKCCTLGALWGHDFDTWPDAEGEALARFLGVEDVADWNDAPERTAEEVVTALRAFADTLETA